MTIVSKPLLVAIDVYKKFVSPHLPEACRYYPSCSDYAAQSIEKYGAFGGSVRALRRLSRCHPWHEGGHDPVE